LLLVADEREVDDVEFDFDFDCDCDFDFDNDDDDNDDNTATVLYLSVVFFLLGDILSLAFCLSLSFFLSSFVSICTGRVECCDE